MDNKNTDTKLKIIPLGGLHEIGKNTCVFEYGDEIILVDAGLGFPSDEMHGINIVLPDMDYLHENRHRICGMLVTHGHEDHIGGIAYHLKQFDIPIIYGPRLAMSLLRDKLDEAGLLERTTLKSVLPRDKVRLGSSFEVEYLRNTHSMADSCTLAIRTPLGVVIHTGDFKIDHTPTDGERFDLQALAAYGESGVLCLLSDSTNAEVPGFTPSESSVYPNLDRAISQASGRVLVTTFASSVHRLKIILDLAQKHQRKVAVVGRSMLNIIAHARNLGYITCPDDQFIALRGLGQHPDERILILTTGSQGEPFAALTRIAHGEHRQIKIRKMDTVIFSANPIPGNTIAVVNIIDRLMMQGAKVVYGRHAGIHVSGHGAQEDQKLMLALTRPQFFVPVHGEHRMLVKHAQTAYSMGIAPENTVIVNNGDVIEVSADAIQIADRVTSGIKLVDRSGIVRETVMKQRQQLAADGAIAVVAVVDTAGRLVTPPTVEFRGVVAAAEVPWFQKLMVREIERLLVEHLDGENTRKNGNQIEAITWESLQAKIESALVRLVRREINRQPLVMLVLKPVDLALTQSTQPYSTASVN